MPDHPVENVPAVPVSLTRLALAFGVGLAPLLFAPDVPGLFWTLCAAGVAVFAAVAGIRHRRAGWWLLAAAFAGAVLGLVGAQRALDCRLPVRFEGKNATLTGVIVDLPLADALRVRFPVTVETLDVAGQRVVGPRRVLLSWYGPHPALRAGERWRLTVRLKAPRGFVNPSGFDYERWLTAEGIDAIGYVLADGAQPLPTTLADAPVQRLRKAIAQRLDQHLGAGDAAGMVRGLAIGVSGAVSADAWRALRDTGTAHLLAISGPHVALSGIVAYALVGWLWRRAPGLARRWPAPRAAALAAGGVVFVYAALAGFGVPARRTALMFSVAAIGAASGRDTAAGRLLVLAGLAVLLLDPLAALESGFWLSFGAVAILLWLALGRARRPAQAEQADSRPRRMWRGARTASADAVRLQVAVTAALAPLTLGFFGLLPVTSVPANLIAVPLLGLLAVPLTLLGVLSLPVPVVAAPLLWAAEQVCAGTLAVLETLRGWAPGLMWPPLPWPLLAASGVGVLMLLAPRGVPGRWLGALWCLPALAYRPAVPTPGEFAATVLDVGQGLAVVVRTAQHALVYDSGPRFSDRFSAGESIVLPELARLGVRRLDLLLLSHGDADHAGAAADIAAGIPTQRIVSGTPSRIRDVGPVDPCPAAAGWTWDGVRFDQIAPGVDLPAASDNDRSCLLQVRAASGGSLLLTGDAEVAAQRRLLSNLPGGPVDVVLAPHHGSRGALYAPLIERLTPREVIFSAAYRSRFGHPHAAVTAAWHAAGARLWNTASAGAVVIETQSTGVRLQAQRNVHRRWWRVGRADPA